MMVKKTKLYQNHIDLKGNMVEFGGYVLPTYYSTIKNEHNAVRNTAGLFDVSHMGELIVKGRNAENFLQYITTNDLKTLSYGHAQYSIICNDDGGILDDIIIYKKQNSYMLVVNAINRIKIFNWLKLHIFKDVYLTDISDKIGLIAIQGPKSLNILKNVFELNFDQLSYYQFLETKISNSKMIISRTGYTGELGYELYINNKIINKVWNLLIERGSLQGLVPAGLACRDTLRLEMKFSLYGNDINESINPIEAGLGWLVKFNKKSFIGKNILKKIKNNSKKKSICIEMIEKSIPRTGYKVFFNNINIGKITSGTMSPSLRKGIAIAIVDKKYVGIGNILMVDIRGKQKKAIIVKSPFYKYGTINKKK